jgi:hypothetical protein
MALSRKYHKDPAVRSLIRWQLRMILTDLEKKMVSSIFSLKNFGQVRSFSRVEHHRPFKRRQGSQGAEMQES